MLTDKNFADWHDDVFGFGYGSGEEYWIPALHTFFTELLTDKRTYAYLDLEAAFGPLAAWLLINALCASDIIEYGTSPRFAWLSDQGEMLRDYIAAHDPERLAELAGKVREDVCLRSYCNCGGGEASSCNPLFGGSRR